MNAISKESSLTIHELKKRLKYKIYWVVFFILAFGAGMVLSIQYPNALPVLGVFLAFYLLGFFGLYQQYRQMDDAINPAENTLTAMQNNAALIKKALHSEKLFGLFLMPVAVVCGILLPGLYQGETITTILSDTRLVLILLGCLVVLVPLMHLLGNKMNDVAYGSYLRQLDDNIRKMKEVG